MAEDTKTKRSKIESFFVGNLKMEEKVITNLPNFHYKSEITTCGKKYIVEIKFDEQRAKHQAWLTAGDKKMSLSFFSLPKIAKENVIRSIAYMNGVSGERSNNNQVVGD